jgi:hypothetical protein
MGRGSAIARFDRGDSGGRSFAYREYCSSPRPTGKGDRRPASASCRRPHPFHGTRRDSTVHECCVCFELGILFPPRIPRVSTRDARAGQRHCLHEKEIQRLRVTRFVVGPRSGYRRDDDGRKHPPRVYQIHNRPFLTPARMHVGASLREGGRWRCAQNGSTSRSAW